MDARSSRRFIPFVLAALIGLVLGYAGEAYAKDGSAISIRKNASRGHAAPRDRGVSHDVRSRHSEARLEEDFDLSGGGQGPVEPVSGGDRGLRFSSVVRKPGRDGYSRGYRDLVSSGSRLTTRGSITTAQPLDHRRLHRSDDGRDARDRSFFGEEGEEPGLAFSGDGELFDDDGRSSFGEDGSDVFDESFGTGGGPKIIDVATARLDRRPVGPSGIEVLDAGGARIIRIAPNYGRAGSSKTGDDARTAGRIAGSDRQPWSSGWLRYCARTYDSFDPRLGTYVRSDGAVRFCDAE